MTAGSLASDRCDPSDAIFNLQDIESNQVVLIKYFNQPSRLRLHRAAVILVGGKQLLLNQVNLSGWKFVMGSVMAVMAL